MIGKDFKELLVGDHVIVIGNSIDKGKEAIIVKTPKEVADHGRYTEVVFEDGHTKYVTPWSIGLIKKNGQKHFNKVGDKVYIYDLSWFMILEPDRDGFYQPSWKRFQANSEDYLNKKVCFEIVEMHLKIPALFGDGYIHGHLKSLGEKTYLDTMIKDSDGHLYLTRNEFLFS
jgi:hypothetical protein